MEAYLGKLLLFVYVYIPFIGLGEDCDEQVYPRHMLCLSQTRL
jgi:hypothetical protein